MDAAILAERDLPYGCAQLVEWDWPSPLDVTVCEARHMIEMSLPPFATDGTAAFPELDAERYSYMGNVFVRPAGVAMHARCGGGRIRVIRVAVQPGTILGGCGLVFDPARPADGLDLRSSTMRLLLGRLRDELLSPAAGTDTLIRAYADALVIEAARTMAARQTSRRAVARLADWQYARVLALIEGPGEPPTLAQLAAACGISARHFTRLYRALTGESAADTIERVRMRRAMDLLERGDLSVKSVGAAVGFARDSAFSAAFRRATGMAPRTWSQRHRALH